MVVFWKFDFAKAASRQCDGFQAIGREQRLVHFLHSDTGKADQLHLIIFGEIGEGIQIRRVEIEHRNGIGMAAFQFFQISLRCCTASFTQLM